MNERSLIFVLEMRQRDENKENQVRTKALEMLVSEGFSGFSMQKLAKAAGVSPATLYIYYKDKDDLIIQIGIEEGRKMTEATFENFDPDMSFAEGLRIQWKNRAKYWLENPISTQFSEQIKHSPYRERINAAFKNEYHEKMGKFVRNAMNRNELVALPIDVYWTIAFAPLYMLIRFHQEGKSIDSQEFTLTDTIFDKTLELVLKALKP